MTRCARVGVAGVAVALVATACGGGDNQAAPPSATSSPAPSVAVVAVGDSDATGIGDPSGSGWVGRYGTLLQHKIGEHVVVDNRASEGKTSDQLLSELSSDDSLRQALASADVVLIGIGGADLNAGDNALSAGQCKGRACYAKILRSFNANIASIAHEVRRAAPNATLRAISLPNAVPGAGKAIPSFITADIGRYQVIAERTSVCHAMRANGGKCVDVVRAFNGASANGDAYAPGLMTKDPCCYPSAKGQQLIARLLLASGVPNAQ